MTTSEFFNEETSDLDYIAVINGWQQGKIFNNYDASLIVMFCLQLVSPTHILCKNSSYTHYFDRFLAHCSINFRVFLADYSKSQR